MEHLKQLQLPETLLPLIDDTLDVDRKIVSGRQEKLKVVRAYQRALCGENSAIMLILSKHCELLCSFTKNHCAFKEEIICPRL